MDDEKQKGTKENKKAPHRHGAHVRRIIRRHTKQQTASEKMKKTVNSKSTSNTKKQDKATKRPAERWQGFLKRKPSVPSKTAKFHLRRTATSHRDNPKRKPSWQRYLNRLNVVLVVVFALFAILLVRLADLQIVNGHTFEQLVTMTQTNIAESSVPRGYIEDRNGKRLVDNEGLEAISYTRGPSVSGADMANTADRLAGLIEMNTDGLQERDLKDYWIASNEKTVNERLDDKEKQLEGSALNEAQLKHVSDEEIQFNDQQKEAAAIYKKMNAAYAMSPTYIKNDKVTTEEIARVSENIESLPGVSTGMDWKRTYPEGDLLKSVLGGVTSESRGLPEDQAAAYLAQGYARNDRVGNSYIEQTFDEFLRGAKTRYKTEINQNGEVAQTSVDYAGKQGDTVKLTIDADLQKKIEGIADDYLKNHASGSNRSIYFVVSNPKTGELLSIVGRQKDDDGQIVDDALGTFTSSFTSGSVVKGATIAAGYYYGVLKEGSDNIQVDEPLYFQGTPRKASWWANESTAPRSLSDIQALEVSSNVYMIKTAMAIGGVTEYYANMPLGDLDDQLANKLRYIYRQFGLGAKTEIDLPNEASGITGDVATPGNALDLSFGQFDTFTPMQLNQYVSTIANNGNRMALHILDQIEQTPIKGENNGQKQIVYQSQPKLLNQIQATQNVIERIQRGFWGVTNSTNGSGHSEFAGSTVTVAGKTGTAEVGDGIINSTFVGYAPFDDPQMAISVVLPGINSNGAYSTAAEQARKVTDLYFGK
ncbi:MAG: penicillin-binding transpeptidase domain-containing protein [Aerococcus sp.]|nr:penicillin-binding transpeptidase domain-containing protein [Aerococcus sp.]